MDKRFFYNDKFCETEHREIIMYCTVIFNHSPALIKIQRFRRLFNIFANLLYGEVKDICCDMASHRNGTATDQLRYLVAADEENWND